MRTRFFFKLQYSLCKIPFKLFVCINSKDIKIDQQQDKTTLR